mmetsp:Transcript_33510/g.75221  ORF Transcript_33510/g.75221 Transcript_33510/m.75221 type:complete len:263 (-) Transcript_33510:117-905(-)
MSARDEEHEEGKLDTLICLAHHEHVRLQVVDGHEGFGEVEGDIASLVEPHSQADLQARAHRDGYGVELIIRHVGLFQRLLDNFLDGARMGVACQARHHSSPRCMDLILRPLRLPKNVSAALHHRSGRVITARLDPKHHEISLPPLHSRLSIIGGRSPSILRQSLGRSHLGLPHHRQQRPSIHRPPPLRGSRLCNSLSFAAVPQGMHFVAEGTLQALGRLLRPVVASSQGEMSVGKKASPHPADRPAQLGGGVCGMHGRVDAR